MQRMGMCLAAEEVSITSRCWPVGFVGDLVVGHCDVNDPWGSIYIFQGILVLYLIPIVCLNCYEGGAVGPKLLVLERVY